MKKLLLTLLLLLAVTPVTGQQSILGRVADEQGDPLPRASIRIQAGSKMVKFTSSDNDGNFEATQGFKIQLLCQKLS